MVVVSGKVYFLLEWHPEMKQVLFFGDLQSYYGPEFYLIEEFVHLPLPD